MFFYIMSDLACLLSAHHPSSCGLFPPLYSSAVAEYRRAAGHAHREKGRRKGSTEKRRTWPDTKPSAVMDSDWVALHSRPSRD